MDWRLRVLSSFCSTASASTTGRESRVDEVKNAICQQHHTTTSSSVLSGGEQRTMQNPKPFRQFLLGTRVELQDCPIQETPDLERVLVIRTVRSRLEQHPVQTDRSPWTAVLDLRPLGAVEEEIIEQHEQVGSEALPEHGLRIDHREFTHLHHPAMRTHDIQVPLEMPFLDPEDQVPVLDILECGRNVVRDLLNRDDRLEELLGSLGRRVAQLMDGALS